MREYWLIDPLREQADIYSLQENKRYRRLEKDDQGRLVSGLLSGFALAPAVLWQENLPRGSVIIRMVREME